MRISVELDGGLLPDAYGKYAPQADRAGRLSIRSFPFEVSDIPAGTESLAILFFDWDSVPVCGFPWIHWCALLDGVAGAETVAVPDDASRVGMDGLSQGFNSSGKNEPEVGRGYVGPCPPDRDHVYTLRVYALDYVPELDEPFWANALVASTRGHMLAHAQVELPSRA